MAASRLGRATIRPWEGTGWPPGLFRQQDGLVTWKHYLCTRKECDNVLRDPIQLECGHRVCKDCLDIIRQLPNDERICNSCVIEYNDELRRQAAGGLEPMDEDELHLMEADARPWGVKLPHALIKTEKWAEDRAAAREVGRMDAVCPYGCGETHFEGKPLLIKTLERHMNECQLRLVSCEKCTVEVKYSDLENHLTNDCDYRLVECPNDCGKRGILGKDLTKHMTECAMKPPQCWLCGEPYEGSRDSHLEKECRASTCPFGCTDVKQGELIKDHLRDQSKAEVHTLGLKHMLEGLSSSPRMATGQTTIPSAQMTAILDRLLQLECRSERAERQLEERLNQLTSEVAVCLMDNAGRAESNRRALENLDVKCKALAGEVHLLSSYDTTFKHLAEKVEKLQAETNEALTKLEGLSNIRVAEMEDQKTLLKQYQMTSFNGRLIWKIDHVQSKKSEAHIRHSIFSHPFFTEVYGYKMCARIYFNGDGNGKNTHVSLFFVVMKGDYDALLPWPFQQKVTMKLKNQAKKRSDIVEKFRPEPSSSSFAQPKNEMNIASGCPQFATQEMVFSDSAGYVVDDTMFIEIIVDNSYQALHGLNVSVQETRGASSSSAFNK